MATTVKRPQTTMTTPASMVIVPTAMVKAASLQGASTKPKRKRSRTETTTRLDGRAKAEGTTSSGWGSRGKKIRRRASRAAV
jgi:hypothetical protein